MLEMVVVAEEEVLLALEHLPQEVVRLCSEALPTVAKVSPGRLQIKSMVVAAVAGRMILIKD